MILFNSKQEENLKSKNDKLLNKFNDLDNKLNSTITELEHLSNMDDSLYRTVLGANPLSSQVRTAGAGGGVNNKELFDPLFSTTILEISDKLNNAMARIKVQKQSYDKLFSVAKSNEKRMSHLPAIMPVSDQNLMRIGAGFGMRFHPILKFTRLHEGQDFMIPVGTEVYSTADGRVVSRRFSTTFGKLAIINHGYGIKTYYAHLKEFSVRVGQQVKRGELIGLSGNSGLSSGPHLHYEVHVNGKEVDPVNYFFNDLTPEEYEKVIVRAKSHSSSMD